MAPNWREKRALVPKHNEPLLGDNTRPANTNNAHSISRAEEIVPDTNMYYVTDNDIVSDLYSVGSLREEKDKKESVPFMHGVELAGPKGEKVRFRSCFDDGAMVNGLDETMYLKMKEQLSKLEPSRRVLRVADGRLVPSLGIWN